FNPMARGAEKRIEIKGDRFDHWVSQGAQTSDRVKKLHKDWVAAVAAAPAEEA
ncbi:MAG: 30S ribosomal protein S16, partial [Gammaproteobacteria bacterium]|nr:30S ribosomal protein S16 [Gammaproteobacteria bacterium]